MEMIIEDMLMIFRVETGEYPYRPEWITAPFFFDSVRELVSGLLSQKEQTLGFDLPEDFRFYGDAKLLEHLFYNLISNAVRYSPGGSSIRIIVKPAIERTLFQVADCGPGIPVAYREKIFERFFRIDLNRSRAQGGTGLGLSIVRHIVLIHRGTIRVGESDCGGALFEIGIPSGEERESDES